MRCAPTSENMGFLGGLALLPTIASLAPPVIATPIIESMFFHQKLEHQVLLIIKALF
jgi:hypothetical protein